MGIKNLNKFLEKNASEAFFSSPITAFSGKRVAIDSNNWMYTNMSTALKIVINRTDIVREDPNELEIRREWLILALNFICRWLSYHITPIFVFDGEHPTDKDTTKSKRRQKKIEARNKITELRTKIQTEPTPALINDLRKELKNYTIISKNNFEFFRNFILNLGIPCFQATGDGEQLCSSMVIDNYAAAVFSADTDNLVYKCPLMITKFSNLSNQVPYLECVRLDKVLTGLKISHPGFVDLCIMAGCDFNVNIPNYGIGKSYKLLQKHFFIDNLPENLNIECLNHIRCREIFKYVPCDHEARYEILTSSPLTKPLEEAGLLNYLSRLTECYRQWVPTTNGSIFGPPKFLSLKIIV